MTSALRRIFPFVAALALFGLVSPAMAQNEGNLSVTTAPSGSLVTLQGDVTLSGVAPLTFTRLLVGRYQVDAVRDGYERYHSVAYLSATQLTTLDIKLVPKTRVKAFFRSVIIPGWGQRYYGSMTKSTLFLFGSLAGAAGYLLIKDDYDSKIDDYNDRIAQRAAATQWSDLSRLNAEVRDAQKKANDAENRLNIITVAAVGIYAFNILDAILFFPEYDTFADYKPLSVRPRTGGDSVGLDISLKF